MNVYVYVSLSMITKYGVSEIILIAELYYNTAGILPQSVKHLKPTIVVNLCNINTAEMNCHIISCCYTH